MIYNFVGRSVNITTMFMGVVPYVSCCGISFLSALLLLPFLTPHIQGVINEGPSNVTYLPGLTPLPIELTCNVSGVAAWSINGTRYFVTDIPNDELPGHNRRGPTILVDSPVNNTEYICVSQTVDFNNFSDPAYIIVAGVPAMVPGVTVDNSTINIKGSNVTFTLRWREPFNNLDPIVNYTVSYFGNGTCPLNFTTTDNTTRSYPITNLTTMTSYTFSVVATNFVGSGKAGTQDHVFHGIVKEYVTEFKLTCKPVDVHHECNVSWNAVSLKNTSYQVFYNDTMNIDEYNDEYLNIYNDEYLFDEYIMMNISNSSITSFTFTPQSLLDDVRNGTVSASITTINICTGVKLDIDHCDETIDAPSVDHAVIFVAMNLTSYPEILDDTSYTVNISTNISLTISCSGNDDPVVSVPNNTLADIMSITPSPSDSSDATFVHDIDEATDRYSMTIIANLHNDSGADKIDVIVMPEKGMNITASGSMIANSSIAVVNITELECGTDYTIIAGGVMSNGTLAGPRLILGKCPKISCVFIQSSDDPSLNFTSTPMPISTSSPSSVVYIVSGAIGGAVIVIIIIFIVVVFYIVKRRSKDPEMQARVKPIERTKEKIDDTQKDLPENQDVPEDKSTNDMPEDKSNNDMPEDKSNNDMPEDKSNYDMLEDKSNNDMPEDKSNIDLREDKSNNNSPEDKSNDDSPEDRSNNDQQGGKQQNEDGDKSVDVSVLQGPKIRGGDNEHSAAYGQVAENKEKPIYYAEISAHKGPRKRPGGDEHVVTYGQVAGPKP